MTEQEETSFHNFLVKEVKNYDTIVKSCIRELGRKCMRMCRKFSAVSSLGRRHVVSRLKGTLSMIIKWKWESWTSAVMKDSSQREELTRGMSIDFFFFFFFFDKDLSASVKTIEKIERFVLISVIMSKIVIVCKQYWCKQMKCLSESVCTTLT